MAKHSDAMKMIIDGETSTERWKGQGHAETDDDPKGELRLEEA